MTIHHGYDFSDYDWRYWADRRKAEAERRLRDNRCICIWQPGDNARCPEHGITREGKNNG